MDIRCYYRIIDIMCDDGMMIMHFKSLFQNLVLSWAWETEKDNHPSRFSCHHHSRPSQPARIIGTHAPSMYRATREPNPPSSIRTQHCLSSILPLCHQISPPKAFIFLRNINTNIYVWIDVFKISFKIIHWSWGEAEIKQDWPWADNPWGWVIGI